MASVQIKRELQRTASGANLFCHAGVGKGWVAAASDLHRETTTVQFEGHVHVTTTIKHHSAVPAQILMQEFRAHLAAGHKTRAFRSFPVRCGKSANLE
jgi:hypothetical protein